VPHLARLDLAANALSGPIPPPLPTHLLSNNVSKAHSRRRWRASARSEYVGAVQYLAVLENELSGWIPP
jgi:hypothetical protein